MTMLDKRFQVATSGQAAAGAVVQGEHYRFTLLTSKLIRMEYAEDGIFEDRPTQAVWNRQFEVPEYRVVEDDSQLQIITQHLHLYYQKGKFKGSSLYIDLKGNFSASQSRWHFGEQPDSLKGTYRTLDEADGAVALDEGVLSKNGFSLIDDSSSLLLTEEGWVEPRKADIIDLYFFGYGREYLLGIRDFYRLTGTTPLLPRQVLGNWWSRYWPYDATELTTLINRFEAEDIPFSVCVLDMDWHLVDIDSKYGSGWTGYTWNKELFPEPAQFMNWLNAKNLWVTLNLHPADGVQAHEEMYPQMAQALGLDPASQDPITFDFSDKKFVEAYFTYLHHPQEQDGVNFWWLDWQQGSTSQTEGLDPLWMLNHYHSLDLARDGKRPLTFSRYAGVGSHRYPIGFSGDTCISWDSYAFQPYFTSTASNIGYGWWSHDIGGHFMGAKDDELSARWLQFGTFSPILRLHSSCSIFNGKEPWRYSTDACETMKTHLRLRHQLVPYIYTMNWRNHAQLTPFIQPIYYHYPDDEQAYQVPNQYFFGSELMVCPITSKIDPQIGLASVNAWLPQGIWIDFFDGTVYHGDKTILLSRDLSRQPVLAKAGAIIPMAEHQPHENGVAVPNALEILVFPGKDNVFELYEDDGESMGYQNGQYAQTPMELLWGEDVVFKIRPVSGDATLLPKSRSIRVLFRGYQNVTQISVMRNGERISCHCAYDATTQTFSVDVGQHDSHAELLITLTGNDWISDNDNQAQKLYHLLDVAQIDFNLKEQLYQVCTGTSHTTNKVLQLQSMEIDKALLDALLEVMFP